MTVHAPEGGFTVAQLIEALQELPQDRHVVVSVKPHPDTWYVAQAWADVVMETTYGPTEALAVIIGGTDREG